MALDRSRQRDQPPIYCNDTYGCHFEGTASALKDALLKQFEIWWADLPKPIGRRPVLLLSRNEAYEVLNEVLVADVTTVIRKIPVEVVMTPAEGVPRRCAVNLDNIRTIPKSILAQRITRLPPPRHSELKKALGYALGWDELTNSE